MSKNPQAEVERRFGVLPNFFALTPDNPEITESLWGFACFAYLDSPLPSLFKERLFVYLSRFCDVRYCITRHVGFLIGLGHASGDAQCPAQSIEEVIRLIRRPLPRGEDLESLVSFCAAHKRALPELPDPDSPMEVALFACASHTFLQTPQAPRCLNALKGVLGETRFQYLMVFLAFVRTAHYWTKVHTELMLEDDLLELVASHESLAKCLFDDPEAGASDFSQKLMDELTSLREDAARHDDLLLLQQRENEQRLRRVNAELGQRLTQLQEANAEVRASRSAAINLMEDAVYSRRAVEKLNAEMSEASERKNEFLAMLGHELRNPLAPIRNMLEILKRSDLSPELVQQALGTMERQLDQMTRLIEDLLDVSRISRGKIDLRKGSVDLGSVLKHAVESARPQIQTMGHDLTVTVTTEPLHLNADPARLSQVVGNLLNNACKFTDNGGCISLSALREGGEAVIRVADNGIGIAADELTRIFQMFAQVETSLERSGGGLGLGLPLVKNLVEMHGGTVEAHSDGAGRGSEFVVRLPLAREAPQKVPLQRKVSDTPQSAAQRILVVDDNRDAADSLALLLTMEGNQTQTAYDGPEAVEAAETFRPHVTLLDIGLPRMNGYEVARQLRQQPWGKDMLLVALTGWGQEEDRQKSKDAGFNDHLVKPVDHAKLTNLLAESQREKLKAS
jgi:signal transduction histidine kinase/CheY-like chemotaxis protein